MLKIEETLRNSKVENYQPITQAVDGKLTIILTFSLPNWLDSAYKRVKIFPVLLVLLMKIKILFIQ
jgi:hypothetical protein